MLAQEIKSCNLCPLYLYLPPTCKPIPGEGPINAKLMIIGEAPCKDEAILERPFVGLCGQFFDKLLEKACISRKDCYISNVVKCRPTKFDAGKANRPPSKEEINICGQWLYKEISLVKPKRILTLGMIPTKYLLKLKSTAKLGDYVGEINVASVGNELYEVTACWHPSWLLQHGKKEIDKVLDILKEIKYAVCN